MPETPYIVLGGTGLIGSAVCAYLESQGKSVVSVNTRNYKDNIGKRAKVLINCNGNSFRYRANQNPCWDFEVSVTSVERSLFDFKTDHYIYISTVDVYNMKDDPAQNHENCTIDTVKLDSYGFHKWLAESLVQKFAARSVILRLGTVIGEKLKKGPIYDILNEQELHMSLDSELSFIDTKNIARAINVIIDKGIKDEIINVTGTGSVRLRDLQHKLPFPIRVAPGSETVKHSYNINNTKLCDILPIHTSMEITEEFLGNYIRAEL